MSEGEAFLHTIFLIAAFGFGILTGHCDASGDEARPWCDYHCQMVGYSSNDYIDDRCFCVNSENEYIERDPGLISNE